MGRAAEAEFRLRARHVFVDAEHVLSPGEVVVQGGLIRAVRKARGSVPDRALLPGLVNAHVHLQLEPLPRSPRQFVPWIRAVLAARKGATRISDVATAGRSLRELLASGTTAVGEVDATGHSLAALRRVRMAGRCYRELIGFDLTTVVPRSSCESGLRKAPTSACPVSRPTPRYSVSPALFQAARARSKALMIHAAETAEEQQFLRTGRGPFRDLLESLGRLPLDWRAPGCGAIEHLDRIGVLGRGTALVHCQHLERSDHLRIANAKAAIVVCPGTIAFFRRTSPPVAAWLRAGIPVALGTDSLASTSSLSMTDELGRAAKLWPAVSPGLLLAMATVHGAAALRRPGLGRLRPGVRADLIGIGGLNSAALLLERFVHGQAPPLSVWLAGHAVARLAAR